MIYFHHSFSFLSKVHFKQNMLIAIAPNMNDYSLIVKAA